MAADSGAPHFWSEELSALAPGVAQLAPKPYLAMNPEDAAGLRLWRAKRSLLAVGQATYRLPLKPSASLARGTAALPVGLPESPSPTCWRGAGSRRRRTDERTRPFHRDHLSASCSGRSTISAFLIWLERRLLALWQDRYGPNRVGPFGLLQVLADMIKIFTKEDWIPPFADQAGVRASRRR